MEPPSPPNGSPTTPIDDTGVSFFESTAEPKAAISHLPRQPRSPEEPSIPPKEQSQNQNVHGSDTSRIRGGPSNTGSNPSSIYDFLVKDMMQNEELIVEKGPSNVQSNFQKFSNSFRETPAGQSKSPHEAEYNDASMNDNNFFNCFRDTTGRPNEAAKPLGAIGGDQESLMLKIMQNLQGNQNAADSSKGFYPNQSKPHGMHPSAYNMPTQADNHTGQPMYPPMATSHTFPTATNSVPLPPLPNMASTFTAPSMSAPPTLHPSKTFQAYPPSPAYPGMPAEQRVPGNTSIPVPFPAPPMMPLHPSRPPADGFTKDSLPIAFAVNAANFVPPSIDMNASRKEHSTGDSEGGLSTSFGIFQNNPAVSVGPRNAPGIGYYTPTVLSSYSFNLPAASGPESPAGDKQSNFTFPPLLMMEVSPSTLYMIHSGSEPNVSTPSQTVSNFLATLHPVTMYTMNLIASKNLTSGSAFNELQIAVLHCTFIINPRIRAIPGASGPSGSHEPQGRQGPHGQSKDHGLLSASPHNAPATYHVIQFRPLISQVTYIPLPEYLFDIQSSTFASRSAVDDGSSFNEYYSVNNVLNTNIKINPSSAPSKQSAYSLFIGQTTYRTTPSVLYYIFNIICKIEILEVEVMRKQPCAFFYVYLKNENEMRTCINKLHKKILFDLHGVWYAQNEREEEKLRRFVKVEREKMFPVLPLPKQCMVVERRNSVGGGGPNPNNRYMPDMGRGGYRAGRPGGYHPHGGPIGDSGHHDNYMNPYAQQGANTYPPGYSSGQNTGMYHHNQQGGGYDQHFQQNAGYMGYSGEVNQYGQRAGGYQSPAYPMPVPPMAPPPPAGNMNHGQYPTMDGSAFHPSGNSAESMLHNARPQMNIPPMAAPPAQTDPIELASEGAAPAKKRTLTLCVNTISAPPKSDGEAPTEQ